MPKIIPIHWRRLEKVFLSVGFRFARQEGSHRSYTKPGVARPIVIPTYDEVPVSIIRNNLKTAGITQRGIFCFIREGLKCPHICSSVPSVIECPVSKIATYSLS
jgi:predicted RNA binding protein YcfA (HicA-like mRNA interferase family)